ncbi:unnamed protein product [Bursaphelenchus xylophilus]|uniref:(pine wood nematode) hypothetical protein n=1 Tax=Bursaphelenchus xylophilus TaxID=6326 RepID=A0A7I8XM94_BURXY|nr:unnamed protein product [Bursaphelenchus xylophilus]CAG9121911.1 unnamed protein product [Bursaphelenchus xylophilus]
MRTSKGCAIVAAPLQVLFLFVYATRAEDTYHITNSRLPHGIPFDSWINQTQITAEANCTQCSPPIFLNHTSYAEGEVMLFKNKRSRHRAIPIMGPLSKGNSKFNDALTFKEWLKRVYSEEKAVKVSVRTTDVVRPVMLHLHASRDRFRAPIIIHADVFDSPNSAEKAVDASVFIDSARKLLPEAIISIGWTPTGDYSAINKLDWRQVFRLVELVYNLEQPLILNMKLNDAIHSAKQLEWLLGASRPQIYLVIKGEVTDFVDKWEPLEHLTALASGRKLLFDVDDTWRTRLGHVLPNRKEKRDLDSDQWNNLVFPSPFSMLSTSIVSNNGVAFLGWPNSLAISNKRIHQSPFRQSVSGKVLFLEKRQTRAISPARKSGMTLDFFETEPHRLLGPEIPRSIRVFIGYDGKVSIENREIKRRKRVLHGYRESAVSRLPKSPCYGFKALDRNFRVELEVFTIDCREDVEEGEDFENRVFKEYRTFISLEAPPLRSRRARYVAVGKSGDGAIDFLVQELRHSSSSILQTPMAWITLLFVYLSVRLLA